jgi:glycogen debranching enzyme
MFSPDDQSLIFELVEDFEARLATHHEPDFGISPSADPKDNYHNQVWARDFAHAAGNYFSHVRPEAVAHSLETIFRWQRADGMLPYRIEREYEIGKFTPGFRWLSKHAFTLIEKKIRRRGERPVYENQDFGGGEDTVPIVLIAAYEFFNAAPEGKKFAREHFAQFKKAVEFFAAKTDPRDGLAVITTHNPDWADTIKRRGKLGGINIWWAEALRAMSEMAEGLEREGEPGYTDDAKKYRAEFERTRQSIMEKLYAPEGYFKAEATDDRLDTVASIFGALYLLSAAEAVRVEEILKKRVARPMGFVNFDPPYSRDQIFWLHRLMFREGEYHNHFVWPWVTLQNIYVKIKIALEHEDPRMRERYKQEALADFIRMANIFKATGGASEILNPHEPAASPISNRYAVPMHFMGSLAGYVGVYRKMKKLGWVA